ncbi:MAG: Crp/Fnr family transcriptional regulator [Prolixibacteraceae bacterium]|nr:Crp/Fnr family transcriptional regulator [Prolixibacteraceae bacterium]
MENFKTYIHSLTEFSDESWKLLQPALSEQVFKKNEFLLKEGTVCNALFYIEKGYCRSFYEMEGEEKNIAFFFENEIATNIESFGSGEKSAYNIVACEPLCVFSLDKKMLYRASQQAPEIETLGRKCIRRFATKQESFSNLLKIYSAKNRLHYLETNYPEMLQRVPLYQLASFLGVARETLSRIRKKNQAV